MRSYAVFVFSDVDLIAQSKVFPAGMKCPAYERSDAETRAHAEVHMGTVAMKWGKGAARVENWSDCEGCGVMLRTDDLDARLCLDCAQPHSETVAA